MGDDGRQRDSRRFGRQRNEFLLTKPGVGGPTGVGPLGAFTHLTIGGFNLDWVNFGDQETVASAGGQNVLQDSDQANGSGAQITISRVGGGVFRLLSADIAALAGETDYRIDIGSSTYGPEDGGPSISTSFETVNPSGTADVTGVSLNIVDLFSYHAPYALTASAHERVAIERILSGAAMSAFQASQQASTIAV